MAFSPENLYQIKADTRENSDDFKRFQAAYPQGSAFWSFLSYNPGPNPFREFRRHVRIVAHLRRGDISGKLLFDEAGREAMLASNPEKMRGTHFRNLLTIEDVVSDIEHRYPDQEIALFVSSDGVSRLKRKFAGFQETVEKIDAMERDLHETPCQLPQQVTFVGSEPSWVCWRFHTLETRMESWTETGRPVGGIRLRRRLPRFGWSEP
jgi:hypothetical protein